MSSPQDAASIRVCYRVVRVVLSYDEDICASMLRDTWHVGTRVGGRFAQSPTHLIPHVTARRTFAKGGANVPQSDPHHYTWGRWLRDDTARRQARYADFVFQLLCDRVIRLSPGATAVRSWLKKEGGFNGIYMMDLDSGSRLVARLPYPGVGLPQRLATASEVATIAYLQQHTTVPIPRVLEWNSDPQNPVGCEYIIMNEARGVLLTEKWPQMTGPQRVRCIDSIFQNMKQLQNQEFSGYGSLYLRDEISLGSTEKIDLVTPQIVRQFIVERWDELNLQVDRPEVDVSVIREDRKAYDLFVAAQTLKKDLAGLLECETDGWVRAEAYEATQKYHRELFHGMLQAVLEQTDPDPSDPVKDEETLRAIWPFDLDI